MIKSIVSLCLLILASACAQLPKVELQAYRDALQASRSAAEPLLESYTVAERAESAAMLERKDPNFQTFKFHQDFDAEDAQLASSLAVPPGTEATQLSFAAITRYTDTLVALAENKNIEEAQAQLQLLTTDLRGVTSNVSAFVPQAGAADAAIGQLGRVAGVLLDVLTPVIQQDNREQFRIKVLEGHDEVELLIGHLRDLTGPQYRSITGPLQLRWQTATPDERAVIVKDINGWHRAFADYVILLDVMKLRLGDLEEAVRNPKKTSLLTQAVVGASDVRAYSDILRRSVAELRAPK